ncbi:unnamed protein product [Fraxinus pennsylvanica]|uniref:Uncharacterized protein n=1 Tax=Fraxinus pennsylvanica TaxID=56036 RepID=A0AAD2EGN1_9LAMI|nr:unnamed protein product [Fraxinus pennsylvanica]
MLYGPPLAYCSESTRHERNWLSGSSVAGIIVAIVFSSTLICLGLLYVMLKMCWKWRKVSIACSDTGKSEPKKEEEWFYGEEMKSDECWNVNTIAILSSQDKQMSNSDAFVT